MRRLSPPSKRPLVAALFALLAGAVVHPSAAQSIYKSTLPDGNVVYSGKPEKGAAKVEKLPPAAPIIEVDPTATEAQRQREKEQVEQLEKRLAARKTARDKAEAEIFAAKDAIAAAEKSLAAGKEPLPGERVATADGGSRLSEAYFDRVKRLDDEVKAAKERLEKAYRERGALE
jgi:hypothetical protein